jgi:hypothetical protein
MGIARSIGQAIINRLAPTGISANQIIRLVRGQGGGYQRSQMLDDIRTAAGKAKNQYWVEQLNSNDVVPDGLMVNKNLNYPARYRVYGNFAYYDNTTDDYYTVTKSFYTDDLASVGSWSDDFQSTYGEVYNTQGIEAMGFQVTAVERNSNY